VHSFVEELISIEFLPR